MPDTVIEIEHLFKEYRLGLIGYGTLREDLQTWWAKARGKEDPNSMLFSENQSRDGKAPDHILALNDINLEVKRGERLGIIGKNGAGKTTLLKILSRIASPTKGTARIKGRVASLIAVGTGFHGELTGRENIYLNGSILGLRKFEIDQRYDEIVDFSGVEDFIDTPVKRYSSGMGVRLGFAVAAHLDPDVLIVDEVLAVGDAEFRKKALGKMKNVSEGEGRTVLFVSHNMDSIKDLCTRSILLEQGKIVSDGPTEAVIDSYLSSAEDKVKESSGEKTWSLNDAPGDNLVRLMAIRTKDEKGNVCSKFDVTEPFQLEIDYYVYQKGNQLAVSVEFQNSRNVGLFVAQDDYSYGPWGKQSPKKRGLNKARFYLPQDLFDTGTINLTINIYRPPEPGNSFRIKEMEVFSFSVFDSFSGQGARGNYPYHWGSPAVRPRIKCVSEYIGEEGIRAIP